MCRGDSRGRGYVGEIERDDAWIRIWEGGRICGRESHKREGEDAWVGENE